MIPRAGTPINQEFPVWEKSKKALFIKEALIGVWDSQLIDLTPRWDAAPGTISHSKTA